jgi:rod shape-determining protein MreD
VRTVGVLAALGLAIVLQATLSGMWMSAGTRVNFVLVAVIYVALAFGAVSGLLAGTAGGLAQDALAGGLVGVGGLSKTLVGFFVGVLGAQFIVSQPVPRFVMFVGATFAHELIFQALYSLIESRAFTVQFSALLIQALVNAAVGVLAFQLVEGAPGILQRRQSRGAVFGRRRY